MTWKKIKACLFLLLAAVFLAYYALCISYAWIGVSWLWLWPLAAVFCLVRAFLLNLEIRGRLKPPKWLSVLYRAALVLCIAVFLLVEGAILSAMNTVPPEGLDYIIVLWAAVRGQTHTSPLLLRADRALAYLEENPRTVAVASGGKGLREDISEAECIRRLLTEQGISGDRILLEDRSSNTMENLINSYALIPQGSTVGIVTSSFHLYRALLAAKQAGHPDAYGIPAKTLLPLGIHYTVREFFGVVRLLLPLSAAS